MAIKSFVKTSERPNIVSQGTVQNVKKKNFFQGFEGVSHNGFDQTVGFHVSQLCEQRPKGENGLSQIKLGMGFCLKDNKIHRRPMKILRLFYFQKHLQLGLTEDTQSKMKKSLWPPKNSISREQV